MEINMPQTTPLEVMAILGANENALHWLIQDAIKCVAPFACKIAGQCILVQLPIYTDGLDESRFFDAAIRLSNYEEFLHVKSSFDTKSMLYDKYQLYAGIEDRIVNNAAINRGEPDGGPIGYIGIVEHHRVGICILPHERLNCITIQFC
jgi:hypothetical protein